MKKITYRQSAILHSPTFSLLETSYHQHHIIIIIGIEIGIIYRILHAEGMEICMRTTERNVHMYMLLVHVHVHSLCDGYN